MKNNKKKVKLNLRKLRSLKAEELESVDGGGWLTKYTWGLIEGTNYGDGYS